MPRDSQPSFGSLNSDVLRADAPSDGQQAQGVTSLPESSSTGDLNFELATGIDAKTNDILRQDKIHESTASGLSVVLAALVLLVGVAVGQRLSRAKTAGLCVPPLAAKLSPSWHALSFVVASFLGLNVLFGGMTVFLLNGESEDAETYFQEISALKLARLSHEHFFGYGVLFGTLAALAIFFVSPTQKRVLIPVTLCFFMSALDASSWWLARFVSPGFHTLTLITGSLFALAFLVLYVQLAFVNLKYLRKN